MVSSGMPHIDTTRKERLDAFAKYVAILPWFNSNILHKLYLNVFTEFEKVPDDYDQRAITCADLMQSPSTRQINYNVFMIEWDIQDALREAVKDVSVRDRIAEFMHAYCIECRIQFLGPKFVESFRIEANAILNPQIEGRRITQKIVNRLNQIKSFDAKKKSVGYYLNVLNQNASSPEQEELIKFLEGYQQYDKDSDKLPEEWSALKNSDTFQGDTITIKLPSTVKEAILAEITNLKPTTQTGTLHAVIIGIDEYRSKEIFSLDHAQSDAEAMTSLLRTAKLDRASIKINSIENRDGTKDKIIAAIKESLRAMTAQDTLLFFYAGYGGVEAQAFAAKQSNINSDYRTEGDKYLVCHDTQPSSASYGLAISEISYLLSSMPEGARAAVILDTGFQTRRPGLVRGQKFRSLAWDDNPRPFDAWIYSENRVELETATTHFNFNGVIFYAAAETEHVMEDAHGGRFTRGLIQALEKQGNAVSYEELAAGPKAIQWPSTGQSPYLEVRGSFNKEDAFLKGFLRQNGTIPSRIRAAHESNELDLASLGLDHVPVGVFTIKGLKTLDISGNQIVEIPPEIGNLTALEVLVAFDNPITKVALEIGNLAKLRAVMLYDCALTAFPKGLLSCPDMQNLQLARNEIHWMPMQVLEFDDTTQLDLTGNPLLNVPLQSHIADVVEHRRYYNQWKPRAKSSTVTVLVIGMDYRNELRNVKDEVYAIKGRLSEADIECHQLINPSTLDLFASLYQYQHVLSILHLAAFHVTDLSDPSGNEVRITNESFVEMFRCVRADKFNTPLVVLNSCDTGEIASMLLDGIFDVVISIADKVEDRMAFEFSREFYSDISNDIPIGEAFRNTEKKFID